MQRRASTPLPITSTVSTSRKLEKVNYNNPRTSRQGSVTQVGLKLALPERDRLKEDQLYAMYIQCNYYDGAMFGKDIFTQWKKLNFTQKVVMELARLIQDKEEVLKHVEKQRIKREEQENKEMEELEELSPIKQKQILKQIQNKGTSPLLKNQKTILKLTRMLS